MRKAVKIFAVLIVSTVLLIGSASAQSIKLVRTDVDSARSNFVTATYLFGVDIILEDVEDCNGAEFELAFNNVDYIKYSEWQEGGFGDSATTQVIPIINDISGQGRIYVLVISGEPIKEAHLDNPKVIHLDFAVSQTSPHGRQATFSFANAHATVKSEGEGKVLDLTSEPTVYDIHGFVNVWPGDTDNNGVVDEVDMDKIALHLNHGRQNDNFRTFKRVSSSALWMSQRVLSWDSASVTYADCDGDGNITPFDMLIIPLNFMKSHTAMGKSNPPDFQSERVLYTPPNNTDAVRVPVTAYASEPYIAAAMDVSWKDIGEDWELIGFEKGDLFSGVNSFIYANLNETEKTASVVVGDYQKNLADDTGVLFNALLVNKSGGNDAPAPNITSAIAMSDLGYTFPFGTSVMTETEDDERLTPKLNIRRVGDMIRVETPKNANGFKARLFNNIGAEISTDVQQSSSNEYYLNLSGLSSGAYLFVFAFGDVYETYRFNVVK